MACFRDCFKLCPYEAETQSNTIATNPAYLSWYLLLPPALCLEIVKFCRNKVFLNLAFIEIKHGRLLYLEWCNCVIKYYELETVIKTFLIICHSLGLSQHLSDCGLVEESTEAGLYIIFAIISSQIYTYNPGECFTGCHFMTKRFEQFQGENSRVISLLYSIRLWRKL